MHNFRRQIQQILPKKFIGAIILNEIQNLIIYYQHNENIFDHMTCNLYILKISQSKQMDI